MEIVLQAENIEKVYGNRGNVTRALNGVSFSIQKGEFVGIMGASGSGKSTLLNCISTIDTVTSGHVWVEGQDITKLKGNKLAEFRRQRLGFMFQDYNLLDTLTAYENIALALSILDVPTNQLKKRVVEVARAVNIEAVLEKYPYQMSGGQQQRVACARAIATKPALILADEPTGALDSKSAKQLLNNLQKLNKEEQATILMVTHDAYTASIANRILFVKDGVLFNEIYKGDDSNKTFFNRIMDVQAMLGVGEGVLGDE